MANKDHFVKNTNIRLFHDGWFRSDELAGNILTPINILRVTASAAVDVIEIGDLLGSEPIWIHNAGAGNNIIVDATGAGSDLDFDATNDILLDAGNNIVGTAQNLFQFTSVANAVNSIVRTLGAGSHLEVGTTGANSDLLLASALRTISVDAAVNIEETAGSNVILSAGVNVDINAAGDILADAQSAISLDSWSSSNFTVQSGNLLLNTVNSGELFFDDFRALGVNAVKPFPLSDPISNDLDFAANSLFDAFNILNAAIGGVTGISDGTGAPFLVGNVELVGVGLISTVKAGNNINISTGAEANNVPDAVAAGDTVYATGVNTWARLPEPGFDAFMMFNNAGKALSWEKTASAQIYDDLKFWYTDGVGGATDLFKIEVDTTVGTDHQILFTTGTFVKPGISSLTDTDTGFILDGGDNIGVICSAETVCIFSSDLLTMQDDKRILIASGTAALPGLGFDGDPDLGIYRTSANAMSFSAGGNQQFQINVNGVDVTLGNYYHNATQGQTATPVQHITNLRWNVSTLEYKSRSFSYSGGIVTAIGVESGWIAVP